MVRRVDEPVHVRVGEQAPEAFLWRGRLYAVRGIDAHWSERRSWWRDATEGPGDRQVWRVRAQAGRADTPGIYELGDDGASAGSWTLLCRHD